MAKKLTTVLEENGLLARLTSTKFNKKLGKYVRLQSDAVRESERVRRECARRQLEDRNPGGIPIVESGLETATLLLHWSESSQRSQRDNIDRPLFTGLVFGRRPSVDGGGFVTFMDDHGTCPKDNVNIAFASTGSDIYVEDIPTSRLDDAYKTALLLGLIEVSIPDAHKAALLTRYSTLERRLKENGKAKKPKAARKKSAKSDKPEKTRTYSNYIGSEISTRTKGNPPVVVGGKNGVAE